MNRDVVLVALVFVAPACDALVTREYTIADELCTVDTECPDRKSCDLEKNFCLPDSVFVPGGAFVLGDLAAMTNVNPFSIERFEVSVRDYAECVDAGSCTAPDVLPGCNWGVSGHESHPVNCIDAKQAETYCQRLGRRLPTEEEWEWVARGGDLASIYPWGSEAPDSRACWSGEGANVKAQSATGTCAVGGHPDGDSPLGVHDLAGNVWEWTASPYTNETRVIRGGAWYNTEPEALRAAERNELAPGARLDAVGFRCAF